MSDPLRQEDRLFTYEDYKSWELAEGERYELIDGVVYAMSAPSDRYQAILLALLLKFGGFLEGKPCKVRPAPYDVRLFYLEDETDDTIVQPDISIVCDENKRGPEGCRGAPDMVIEIISPSNTINNPAASGRGMLFLKGIFIRGLIPFLTAASRRVLNPSKRINEVTRKFDLYHRSGVREYWEVYPENKSLHAHVFDKGQILTRIYGEEDRAAVEILPGLEINLKPIFAEQ